MTAVSPTDAWAVGGYFIQPGYFRTLILHWDGHTWSRVTSPNPSPDRQAGLNVLGSVTATSSRNAWAVGAYCARRCQVDGEIDRTLILHWNGARWTETASPVPGTAVRYLTGVTAVSARNAWAAGWYQSRAGHEVPLILHWNGTRWAMVATPAARPGVGGRFLTGIAATSARDAWAVGYACRKNCGPSPFTDQADRTLILHWTGTRWEQAASPSPGTRFSILYGVSAVSGRDAWAVGASRTAAGKLVTLTERWNGAAWSSVPSPSPGRHGSELIAASGLSPSRAWAVGNTCVAGSDCLGPPVHPLILRWNGRAWSAR